MKIGFIGCGNMAKAMIEGILGDNLYCAEDIYGSAKTEETCEKCRQKYGIHMSRDNNEVAREADIIVLAVKPQYYKETILEVRDEFDDRKILITIAPGKTLRWLESIFEKQIKIVRCMPNTPALVREGMTAACANDQVNPEEMGKILEILNSFGKTEVVSEKLLDVVVSVSGSSPAYVFMFIEAMADGAVADGMPRDQAYEFAAQAVLGSAKMLLDTKMHPGELKDMVCSPGGTTIEAVRVLEEKGMRSAVIEAMKACVEKGRNM